MDLDDVADELYGLPLDEFMPVRTVREQEARADGDRELAASIKALGKPSSAAWVCNLLVRHHREEIENLVELGGLLREAQENLAGDDLRSLDVQRRQLVTALTRQARALAHRLGHPVSTTVGTQVEETLRAAMAESEAGDALLEGRLTSAMSYSGMGTASRPSLRVVHPPREKRPAPVEAAPAGRSRSAAEARREEARRAAEERRRRETEEARRALAEAAAAAEEAAAAAEDERRAAGELAARHDGLVDRVEELTLELARTREEATRAGSERSRAERRREAAERRAAEAARARDRAQAALDRLPHDDR